MSRPGRSGAKAAGALALAALAWQAGAPAQPAAGADGGAPRVDGGASPQAAASAAGAASPRALGPALRWEIGEGGAVIIATPAGAAAMPAESLPSPDLSGLSGGRVVLRRGAARGPIAADHQSDTTVVVCARAPGANLAPAAELVAFERLNDLARAELAKGASVDSFQPSDPRDHGVITVAGFVAEGRPAHGAAEGAGARVKMRAEGRHVLGFVGDRPDVLVCSVACSEVSSDAARVCPSVLENVRVEAAFVAPPQPSSGARLAVAAVRRPVPAAGVALGLLLMLAGALVAAWPARRPATSPGPAERG